VNEVKIKGGWQDKILEIYVKKQDEGRTPKILLIHPRVHAELIEEIDGLDKALSLVPPIDVITYLGMQIIQTLEVPDFRVVDDRHWYEE